MKPVKEDIPTFTQFSYSMEDDAIDFQFENAYRFVLLSKLGSLAKDIYDLAPDNLSRPELRALYDDYIHEYWTLLAVKRFIPRHGIHVTQFGVIIMTDPQGTFIPATSAERSIIMGALDDDIAAAETILSNKLKEAGWKFDGTIYRNTISSSSYCSTPDTNGSTGGISAIG